LQQLLQPKPKGEETMTEFRDVYSRITGKIIADLEQGISTLAQAMERRPRRRQDHPPVAS
jgi:antirestriction protein ArdC